MSDHFYGMQTYSFWLPEAEGAPLVLLEAMACGVPWVSTEWGAAAESPPEECGLVIPCRNPNRAAHAIGELLRDRARTNRMGKRARERAVAGYSERQYVRRYLEVLVAKQRSRSIRSALDASVVRNRGRRPPKAQPIGRER